MPVDARTPDSITYSHNIISALDSDALEPDTLRKLYTPYGNEWKTHLRLKLLGFETPVTNEDYSHHEKDKTHVALDVLTTDAAALGAGVSRVIELTGAVSDPFYGRVKDGIMFGPDKVVGVIMSVDKPNRTITVAPQDSSLIIPTVVAGDKLVIYTGISGEGSASVDPAFTRTRKYTNTTQIIDEKVATTGTSLTDATWFEIGGESSGKGMYTDAIAGGEYRMMVKHDGMFWHGVKGGDNVDPTSQADVGGKMRTSDGLLNTITNYGNSIAGFHTGFALADFDEIGQNILDNYGDTAVPIWTGMGYELQKSVETALRTEFGATNDQEYLEKTVNDMLYKPNNSYGAYVNFTYYQRMNFTYMFETLENWSNTETYGNFDFPYEGVAVPLYKSKDQVSGEMFGTIGCRYKALGQYNRKFMTTELVGFGSNKAGETVVSEVDVRNTMWKAHLGNQFMEVQNMSRMRK